MAVGADVREQALVRQALDVGRASSAPVQERIAWSRMLRARPGRSVVPYSPRGAAELRREPQAPPLGALPKPQESSLRRV